MTIVTSCFLTQWERVVLAHGRLMLRNCPMRNVIKLNMVLDGLKTRCMLPGVWVWIVTGVCIVCAPAYGADSGARGGALRIFMDCQARCDTTFLRRDVDYVNFVRDRQDAQVHVLITDQKSGAGTVFELAFFGQEDFLGVEQTLTFNSSRTETSDERRRAMSRILQFGLARFVLETPQGRYLRISHVAPESRTSERAALEDDPWNSWVLSTEVRIDLENEDRRDDRELDVRFSATRTTEQVRVGSYFRLDDDKQTFEFDDGSTFEDTSRRARTGVNVVKSLGENWGIGVGAHGEESSFRNLDRAYRAAAGLEYNVYPYAESAVRQMKFGYTVGQNWLEYNESTVFGVRDESKPDHNFYVEYDLDRRWGDISLDFRVSQFLDDTELYRARARASIDYRIVRGVSLRLWAESSLVRDEVYLSGIGLSAEDILLKRRAVDTDLSSQYGISLRYTFGSIYNNVVNNRLDGGEFAWRIF